MKSQENADSEWMYVSIDYITDISCILEMFSPAWVIWYRLNIPMILNAPNALFSLAKINGNESILLLFLCRDLALSFHLKVDMFTVSRAWRAVRQEVAAILVLDATSPGSSCMPRPPSVLSKHQGLPERFKHMHRRCKRKPHTAAVTIWHQDPMS